MPHLHAAHWRISSVVPVKLPVTRGRSGCGADPRVWLNLAFWGRISVAGRTRAAHCGLTRQRRPDRQRDEPAGRWGGRRRRRGGRRRRRRRARGGGGGRGRRRRGRRRRVGGDVVVVVGGVDPAATSNEVAWPLQCWSDDQPGAKTPTRTVCRSSRAPWGTVQRVVNTRVCPAVNARASQKRWWTRRVESATSTSISACRDVAEVTLTVIVTMSPRRTTDTDGPLVSTAASVVHPPWCAVGPAPGRTARRPIEIVTSRAESQRPRTWLAMSSAR